MLSEEQEICKLIKCSFMMAGQAQSIVSVQSTVPAAITADKRRRLIDILTKASAAIEAALS
jgi:hypothetical protein